MMPGACFPVCVDFFLAKRPIAFEAIQHEFIVAKIDGNAIEIFGLPKNGDAQSFRAQGDSLRLEYLGDVCGGYAQTALRVARERSAKWNSQCGNWLSYAGKIAVTPFRGPPCRAAALDVKEGISWLMERR